MAASDQDVTRRTLLAAERTWLAWWRSAIAAAAAAVAVGGVVPQLVDDSRTPFVVLGAGYAALAVVVFVGAGRRQARLSERLDSGGYEPVSPRWVLALSAAGALLALGTFAAIVFA